MLGCKGQWLPSGLARHQVTPRRHTTRPERPARRDGEWSPDFLSVGHALEPPTRRHRRSSRMRGPMWWEFGRDWHMRSPLATSRSCVAVWIALLGTLSARVSATHVAGQACDRNGPNPAETAPANVPATTTGGVSCGRRSPRVVERRAYWREKSGPTGNVTVNGWSWVLRRALTTEAEGFRPRSARASRTSVQGTQWQQRS